MNRIKCLLMSVFSWLWSDALRGPPLGANLMLAASAKSKMASQPAMNY
jgi:hypothetical protein